MKTSPYIHILSETVLNLKGNGVHSAFVDCVDLLRHHDDVRVMVNQEGWGDLMHAHTYGPYYFWKGRRYRGRRILTVHVIPDSMKGTLRIFTLFMPLVRWYFRLAYSYADICIAISPMVEKTIRTLKADTRIVRIYNPIHTEKFKPDPELRAAGRARLGLSPEAFVVLSAGQVHKRKGIEDFLDIADGCPELTFVWAGGHPFGFMTESYARLKKRIQAAGGHVRFIGDIPFKDMPLIYNTADLFLFPSLQENCPLAPMEAAACGLPVVYRDLPEYAQLYEHPYLKARRVCDFIRITQKIARSHRFRRLAQKMSRQLLSQFEEGAIRKKWLALYREVLQRKPVSAALRPRIPPAVDARRPQNPTPAE